MNENSISPKDNITRAATARAATESSLDAAERLNDTLNAFLEIDREGALKRADQIDSLNQSDKSGLPLAGVPIAIKDNICVRGLQTSSGSRILGPYHPPYNATAIQHLLDAGSVFIANPTSDAFPMRSPNANSPFAPLKNPWDTSRVP